MGADWYSIFSTAFIGIPVPKEALKSTFEKDGFRILAVVSEYYKDEDGDEDEDEGEDDDDEDDSSDEDNDGGNDNVECSKDDNVGVVDRGEIVEIGPYRGYAQEPSIYHGAFICHESFIKSGTSLQVIGPYEITNTVAEGKRMDHLDMLLSDQIKTSLIKAYEEFVGEKPELVPGVWVVSCTSSYNIRLYSRLYLRSEDKLESRDEDQGRRFTYTLKC